ncbi:MAG TPA: hypothetical protein VGA00_10835 [Acidiferrobacterales bacterium]|jgi:hypothetical protein
MAELRTYHPLHPGEPLRKRAPEVDEHGNALSDFMMIFPGLRKQPPHQVQDAIAKMQAVLARYTHAVVFVELNLRLNLLWVSVRPITGIRYEIAQAIRELIPSARLVAHI